MASNGGNGEQYMAVAAYCVVSASMLMVNKVIFHICTAIFLRLFVVLPLYLRCLFQLALYSVSNTSVVTISQSKKS